MSKISDGVSIVMPCFNACKTIRKTIDSIQKQKHKKWELIVVDDGSTDSTQKVVKKNKKGDNRIRLLKLNHNSGRPACGRNIGIKKARFKWVAFIDSDDIWHSRKLEIQLKIAKSKKIKFICSYAQDFHHDTPNTYASVNQPTIEKVSIHMQRLKNRIPLSSVLIDKETISKYPFNESKEYKAIEDYDCWNRILESDVECFKVKAPIVFYKVHRDNISSNKLSMLKKIYVMHKRNLFPFLTCIYFTTTYLLFSILRFFRQRL